MLNIMECGVFMPTFKERFLFLKDEKDVSFDEIAKKIKSNKSSLVKVIHGQYSLKQEMIDSLAEYFDVDKAFLLGESDIRKQNESDYQFIPSDLKLFKKEFKESTIGLLRDIEELDITPEQARIVLRTTIESMKKFQDLSKKNS